MNQINNDVNNWQVTLWWILPVIIILLLLSALFSSLETALTSVNIIRVKELAKTNHKYFKKAKRIYQLVKDYSGTITTLLIANNLVNIALTVLVAFFFDNQLQLEPKISLTVSTLFSLFVVLIFGEVIPKNLARFMPEKILMACYLVPYVLKILFYPLTYLLAKIRLKSVAPSSTERELLELVKTIENEGVLEKEERHLITSAIVFDEKKVKKIMKPKAEIMMINVNTSMEQIKDLYDLKKFTRLPVVDLKTNTVKGILNVKDILIAFINQATIDINGLLQAPLFIPKNMQLNLALEKMQKSKMHMAIVTSAANKTDFLGIVTLEDIIEELVGKIYDEHDHTDEIYEIGHHKFQVMGTIKLKKLFAILQETHPVTEAVTLEQ